jgi:hypothetical protein
MGMGKIRKNTNDQASFYQQVAVAGCYNCLQVAVFIIISKFWNLNLKPAT